MTRLHSLAGLLVSLLLAGCQATDGPDDELPAEPFTVAVVSDTHIWPAPEDHSHTTTFRQVAEELQALDPPVEIVLSTGDNVEDLFVPCEDGVEIPMLSYYRELVEDSYDVPFQVVLGNHDNRYFDTFQGTDCPNQQWVETFEGTDVFPAPYYAAEHRGIQFLILDGTDRATDHDSNDRLTLSEDQLTWLEGQLQTGTSAVILAHQSISPGLEPGDDEHPLAGIITAYSDRILGVFFGHRHRFASGRYSGVPIYETAELARYPEASYHVVGLESDPPGLTILNEQAIEYDVEYGL